MPAIATIIRRLRVRRPLAVTLSVLCLGGLATGGSVAIAAGASGGTRYHSLASPDGELVALTFSRDGRRITRAFASARLQCSDGETFRPTFSVDDVRVTPKGSFTGVIDTGPMDSETGAESRRFTAQIKGRRTRTQVVGTFEARLEIVTRASGATVTCESRRVRYVAVD